MSEHYDAGGALPVPSDAELARIQEESNLRAQQSEQRFRIALVFGACIAAALVITISLGPLMGDRAQLTTGLAAAFTAIAAGFLLTILGRMDQVQVTAQYWLRLRNLIQRLHESSATDSLTGLYNHGYLLSRMQEEISRAERYKRPLSVVILDLNEFKQVNDLHGHLEGDAVLKTVAATIRDALREHDIVARYGGDEFCIVLPETERVEAERLLRRLRDAVAALSDTAAGWNGGKISFGYGVAAFPEDGSTTQALIASADGGLYQEKQSHRLERAHEQGAQVHNLFYDFGAVVASTLDPVERLDKLAETICSSLKLRSASIFWQDPAGAPITARYFTDPAMDQAFAEARDASEFSVDQTVAYQAAQQNEIITVNHMGQSAMPFTPAWPSGADDLWGQWVPIAIQGRRAGALRLFGHHNEAAPLEPGLGRALARLLGGSIQNSLNYQEAHRQRDRLTALVDVGAVLIEAGPLDKNLRQTAQRIVEIVGVDAVTFVTREPGTDSSIVTSTFTKQAPHLAAAWEDALRNQPPEYAEQLRRATENLREPFVVEEPAQSEGMADFLREIYLRGRIRALLVVPLRFQDETLGAMAIISTEPNAFNDEMVRLFRTIASQISPSLKSALLHYELEESYDALRHAHLDAMLRLAAVAEARDPFTGNHLHRLREYSEAIARKLGLSESEGVDLGHAAVVHDIGKLRVPDSLLSKPGKLSEEEWAVIRKHPAYGEELLGESVFYAQARQIARWHHERWDGSGYPDGLSGENIPLGARIVAVADVFDALTSRRPYKEAWPAPEAVTYIKGQSGKHFAPEVVEAFVALADEGVFDRMIAAKLQQTLDMPVGPDERLVA